MAQADISVDSPQKNEPYPDAKLHFRELEGDDETQMKVLESINPNGGTFDSDEKEFEVGITTPNKETKYSSLMQTSPV